jgi:hypothetical protein
LSLLGHYKPKNLAAHDSPGDIRIEGLSDRRHFEMKESAVWSSGCLRLIAPSAVNENIDRSQGCRDGFAGSFQCGAVEDVGSHTYSFSPCHSNRGCDSQGGFLSSPQDGDTGTCLSKPTRHDSAQHTAAASNEYGPPVKIEKFADMHDEAPFSPSMISLKGRREGHFRPLPLCLFAVGCERAQVAEEM